MTRRIYGLETEYGVTAHVRGSRRLSADEAARVLLRPITARHHASNVFLRNGSRLYLDVGSHPEYATAECDCLLDLITHDRAGEALMADLVAEGNQALASEGIEAELVMFKNNTDSYGNSYGTHENYLVNRVADFEAFTEALLPFLVTRQLICGSGKLVRDNGRTCFRISQRAHHMFDAVSSTTTRTRPMINTRDEPHADPRKHRRMHVIVGDANLSDISTWLKVGSMELALRVLETGSAPGLARFTLASAMDAIREVSEDVRGRAVIRLADGSTATGIAIQQAWCEAAGEHADTAELRSLVALWSAVLTAIEAERLDDIARQVDWVIKLRWLERYAARYGLALDDLRLAAVDLAYHAITGNGIFRLLEARGAVDRLTDPAAIEVAKTTPPVTTRAALRGRVVAAGEEFGREVAVDWASLACSDLADGVVLCPDPFAAADERVDRLIERMAREPRAALAPHFATPLAP